MKSVSWDGRAVTPSKIVCIGRNYTDHIKELENQISQEPVIFIKPNSAISDKVLSSTTEILHYEAEISFLVSAGELKAVAFGLDLTRREIQYSLMERQMPWERAKAFDNSAVFSDFVSFDGDIKDLRMKFYINDRLVQHGSYELMLNKPEQLLDEAKSFLTFEDGDVLMSGTPKGVGRVRPGDNYLGKIYDKEKLIVEGSWVVDAQV